MTVDLKQKRKLLSFTRKRDRTTSVTRHWQAAVLLRHAAISPSISAMVAKVAGTPRALPSVARNDWRIQNVYLVVSCGAFRRNLFVKIEDGQKISENLTDKPHRQVYTRVI